MDYLQLKLYHSQNILFDFQVISLNCGTLQGLYAICSPSSLLLKSLSKLLKKVKYLDLS